MQKGWQSRVFGLGHERSARREEEEKEEQEEQEEKEEEKEEEQKEEKEEPVEQGKGRRSSAGRQHLLSPQAADSATMNMVVGINGGREQEHHNQLGKKHQKLPSLLDAL